ncbi:hypothetical protein K431DRAFT_310302 [Polychaeton citri CBS 116435]|uniref:Uncharacterized protein n=1 Tax=Polychaeton citri CBS 116435 TaxID=1314669 RepID=A0A9P4URW5_9PEZI|nr:hypothetical protein K431DRAFT_310302 [Polychaeton citri CBS 116435]
MQTKTLLTLFATLLAANAAAIPQPAAIEVRQTDLLGSLTETIGSIVGNGNGNDASADGSGNGNAAGNGNGNGSGSGNQVGTGAGSGNGNGNSAGNGNGSGNTINVRRS